MHGNNYKFTTFQQISLNSNGRPLILFGAGPIAEKSFRRLHKYELVNIVDNAQNLWGEFELGVEIINPHILKNCKDYFVIICTTSFSEVAEQLEAYSLIPGEDFCVSPILNDLQIIENCRM